MPKPPPNTAAQDDARATRLVILWLLWAGTGVLAIVAFIPAVVVVALFLAVVPAIVLACMPSAFIISGALLAVALYRHPDHRSRAWLPVALTVLPCVLAAWTLNRPATLEIAELGRQDFHGSGTPVAARTVGIQTVTRNNVRMEAIRPAPPLPGRRSAQWDGPGACAALCLGLLLNGQADSVIVASVEAYGVDPAPDGPGRATRYRLEAKARCPENYTRVRLAEHRVGKEDARFPAFYTGDPQSDAHALARLDQGECVVASRASLTEADVVVQEELFEFGAPVTAGATWPFMETRCYPELHTARRLTLYRMHSGIAEVVYRQTRIEGELLPPLLVTWPYVGSTKDHWPLALARCVRLSHADRPYDVGEVLRSRLGLEVRPIGARRGA